jgi:lysophospholipase L1-like esterase
MKKRVFAAVLAAAMILSVWTGTGVPVCAAQKNAGTDTVAEAVGEQLESADASADLLAQATAAAQQTYAAAILKGQDQATAMAAAQAAAQAVVASGGRSTAAAGTTAAGTGTAGTATAGTGTAAGTSGTAGESALLTQAKAAAQQAYAAAILKGLDQASAMAAAQKAAEAVVAAGGYNTAAAGTTGTAGTAAAGTGTAAAGTGTTAGTAGTAVQTPVVTPALNGDLIHDTAIKRGLYTKYYGKRVSITGDSICSFTGWSPWAYGTMYPNSGVMDVNEMWWKRVSDALGMTVCVDASWAGSQTAGNSLDMTGKTGCGIKRIVDLTAKNGTKPDVIFVMLGTNDMIGSLPLGTYYAGKPAPAEGIIDNFADAYNIMLTKLSAFYPAAQIVCFTCFPDTDITTCGKHTNALGLNIESYNSMIKTIAAGHGLQCVDTWDCGIDRQNAASTTLEGIHPNSLGFQYAAAYVVQHMN